MRSSSARERKIIIFERFHCSLENIIQLNWQLVKLIRKIEICSIWVNFCKTRSRPPSKNQQKTLILVIFCAISPKQTLWPPNYFTHFIDRLMISNTSKNYKNLSTETWNIIENVLINTKSSPFMCVTIATFCVLSC